MLYALQAPSIGTSFNLGSSKRALTDGRLSVTIWLPAMCAMLGERHKYLHQKKHKAAARLNSEQDQEGMKANGGRSAQYMAHLRARCFETNASMRALQGYKDCSAAELMHLEAALGPDVLGDLLALARTSRAGFEILPSISAGAQTTLTGSQAVRKEQLHKELLHQLEYPGRLLLASFARYLAAAMHCCSNRNPDILKTAMAARWNLGAARSALIASQPAGLHGHLLAPGPVALPLRIDSDLHERLQDFAGSMPSPDQTAWMHHNDAAQVHRCASGTSGKVASSSGLHVSHWPSCTACWHLGKVRI
jgi:hypothetical protein